MGFALSFIYLAGWLGTVCVMRVRAGIPLWGRIKVFGRGGVGVDWILIGIVIALGWPVALVVWLLRGRPEPRIVFNEKARERARRLASAP